MGTRMTPVNRQVPYTDMEVRTVNQPVTEQYNVNVPTTTTVNENRTVTKFIQTPKKCRQREQIYARICDTNNNQRDMMSSPMMTMNSDLGTSMMGTDLNMGSMDQMAAPMMDSSMNYGQIQNIY